MNPRGWPAGDTGELTPRLTRSKTRRRKAASGVLALIFMALAVVIATAIIMSLLQANLTVQAGTQELTLKVQDQVALARSVTAVWVYDPNTDTVEVNVTNSYTQPITIKRIGIIHADNTIQLHPPQGQPPLNTIIPPGATATLTLTSIPAKPKAITLHATTPTQASTTITAQEPTGGGNNTTTNPWDQASLPTTAPTNTTTWQGAFQAKTQANELLTPQTVTPTIGTGTGTPQDVNVTDNQAYKLEPPNTPQLTITPLNRTAIEWIPNNYDFTQDPLASGQILPQTGTWSWFSSFVAESNYTGGLFIFWANVKTWEDYAFLTLSQVPSKIYVIASFIPSLQEAGTFDIILHNGSHTATFGIASFNNRNLNRLTLYILPPYSNQPENEQWVPAFSANSNYVIMLEYNSITSDYNLTRLYPRQTWESSLIGSLSGYGTPTFIGIGTGELKQFWNNVRENPRTRFDYVFVTNATDPTKVFIVNKTSLVSVRIDHPSAPGGSFTGVYDPVLGAWVVSIFPQTGVFRPVLDGATIVVDDGVNVVTYTATVMGGDYYLVDTTYVAQAVVETQYTGTGTLASPLLAQFNVSVNTNVIPSVTGTVTIEAWNYNTNAWDPLWSTTYTVGATPTPVAVDTAALSLADHVNSTNYARLRVTVTGDVAFTSYVDMLNVNATVEYITLKDALALGHGDTVRVYEITSTLPPALAPLVTVTSPLPGIGWEADFTYAEGLVFVFDGVNLWWKDPLTPLSNAPTPVTSAGTTAGMVALEAFPLGGGTGLLLLYTNATGSYYMVIDASNPPTTIVGETQLPPGLELGGPAGTGYLATASYGSGVYTVLYNTTDGNYYLAYYDGATDTWSLKTIVPGGRVVGLTADANSVYLMLEGGGFYSIDHATTTTQALPDPPFYPLGPSDRMEALPGPIVWLVRASDTNELWYYVP